MTSMVLDQPHELTWGSFVLSSETDPDVPWRCETLAATDFGDAVPILEFIESSLIVDGGEAVVTGWERRTFTVEIRLTAPDGQAMSQAQQALFALVYGDEKPALLWTPPMVGAWTGAFDVIAVKFLRKWDVAGDWSHRERVTRQRVFKLEFTCKTWVRDPEPIEVPALPVPENPDDPPARLVLDSCSSISSPGVSWAAAGGFSWHDPAVAMAPDGTAVRGSGWETDGKGDNPLLLTRASGSPALTVGGLPYLGVRVATYARLHGVVDTFGALPLRIQVTYTYLVSPSEATSVTHESVAVSPDGSGPYYDVIFPAPPGDTLVVQLRVFSGGDVGVAKDYVVDIDEIFATDRVAVSGSSGFQVPRMITIEGSAPTGAAITFDAGPDPLLGSTALIYTGPSEVISLRGLDDGIPPGFTPDTTMMSGAWNTLNGDTVSLVPVARLAESTYDLLARLNFTGLARVNWAARLVAADGSDIPGSDVVRSGEILLRNTTADPWKVHTIASIPMPVVKVEGLTTHKVEIKIWMTTGGASVKVDERWLADRRGAITIVHEPSAFQLSKIELRSPQLRAPRYQVVGTWIGHGSQDIARLTRIGRHRFPPGPLHVFTASDLAKYPACSLRYPRTHSHEPGPALPAPVP